MRGKEKARQRARTVGVRKAPAVPAKAKEKARTRERASRRTKVDGEAEGQTFGHENSFKAAFEGCSVPAWRRRTFATIASRGDS